jgi:hypothetical protein
MADRPRYEAAPSPHFLAALRAAVPGFEPTPLGWFELERELKRRLRIRDQAAYAADHQACRQWTEDEVLEVFGPSSVALPPAADRPAFPVLPLDPWCIVPADLSPEDRAEIVRLVRLVQTDFDPERDPRGWDAVADLVRGQGRPWDEARQMDYRQLAAFFRVRHGQLKIQLGGAIETNTPSIVSYNAEPVPKPAPRPRRESAADLLRQLWTTAEGRQKIMSAGSAERIAILIGVGKTSVIDAGAIWDRDIAPKLKAQRSMASYHRHESRHQEEEGLNG